MPIKYKEGQSTEGEILDDGLPKEKKPPAKQEIPQKHWFLVTVEAIAPVTVEFKVFAENEDAAFEAVERRPHPNVYQNNQPKVNMKRLQKKRATIKNMLTGWINWARNF